MNPWTRLVGGILAAAAALALGVLAAWPIYATPWLWVVSGTGLVLGATMAWVRERWRVPFLVFAATILVVFALTVVPVAVPQSLANGPLRGLADGLAAVALGWKQLLTLNLPVGSYQTVLVPAYIVMLLVPILVVFIALRPGRWPALAALPLLVPVAFGTVFGSSAVSAPLRLGLLFVPAPRELALWLAAAALAACWVAWTSGAARRAALRLGRSASDASPRRGRTTRALVASATVAVALAAGALLAPVLDSGARAVPRDRVDPEIVIRDRPSPLAAYRASKSDEAIDGPLFAVRADGSLPQRLRLAVLDAYDGVDFHVGEGAAGRFARFPSGEPVERPSRVTVEIADGYRDIWAPTAELGSPPSFSGPRASELADAFYVNRETGGAIAVPDSTGAPGLAEGDGYTADMETAEGPRDPGRPISAAPLVDLEAMPELARWIERQSVSADAAGLAELIERLRARGYLSHALSEGEGQRLWLERLAEEYGTDFEPSAGGHSSARVESLFAQLNAQQAAAGERPGAAALVAGIGDDEQFATAAALAARALGFESRVVMGVRLGEDAGVPGVPACMDVCTGEHLSAWIEVRGESGSWVPFDVAPQAEQPPQRLEEGERLPEFPTTPEERDAREVDPPVGLGDQSENAEEPGETDPASWLWPVLRIVGLSAAAVVLLAVPILFLPLAKRLRARRRRAEALPELRALSGWEEMLDRARDAGVEIPSGAGRRATGAALGTAPASWVAIEIDRAVFSREGIDEADADLVWRAADADRAERAASMNRWRRLRAAYSLRSYGVRSRKRGRSEEGIGNGQQESEVR